MDSPLLPTLRGQQQLSDSSDLLADLSLDDGGEDVSFAAASPSRSQNLSLKSPAPPPSAQAPVTATESTPLPTASRRAPTTDNDNNTATSNYDLNVGSGKPKPRFSLFAAPRPPSAEGLQAHGGDQGQYADEDEEGDVTVQGDEGAGEDETIHANANVNGHRPSSGERDDRLRESLYELRSMNEVFDGFLGALESARGHNQRLEIRVRQTKALLDQYTALLGQTEHTQRLLSNPTWTGALDDAAALEAEEAAREEEAERKRVEAEHAAEAARLAEEARARRAEEAEREKERASRGRGRGRGWGSSGTTRGTGIPSSRIPTARTTSGSRGGAPTSGSGLRKPTTSTAGTGTGTGRYGHVQSTGYGASGRKAT